MKVVIIEDEMLMAKDLAVSLQQLDPAIVVSATLSSVSQACIWFAGNELPDLVFSDIQLGDGLSFEIFREHPMNVPIVFCTAYDEYALEAFKTNGIDYILKPCTNASLHDTLQKYRRLQQQFSSRHHAYETLINLLPKRPSASRSAILVFQNERIIPLPVADIALFFIHNKMTLVLCFDQQLYMIGQSLDELEEIWRDTFFRANRQYLVNRKAIKEASHYYARKLLLHLSINFKDTITVSKDKYADFLQWLSG
jgi:two-component system, LytTR family, response regulator LytT